MSTARIRLDSILPHQESDLVSHVLVVDGSALLVVDSVPRLQTFIFLTFTININREAEGALKSNS